MKYKAHSFLALSFFIVLSFSGCSKFSVSKDFVYRQAARIKLEENLEGPIRVDVSHLQVLPEKEKLTFRLKYIGITVAEMVSEIKGKTTVNGREVYHFEMNVKTIPPFRNVFPVNDVYRSYMDTKHFRVVRHEEIRREGAYRKDSVVDYDYEKGKAYFSNKVDNTAKVIDIPDGLHDILTANYYLRMVPWELGDTIKLQIFADEKVYDILGLIQGVKKIHDPDIGRREAYVFVPYAFIDGERVQKGSATGYFAVDGFREPLKGLFKTPIFGSASMTLTEVSQETISENSSVAAP